MAEEQKAFGQQLADEPRQRCAEGGAHSDLFAASRGTRQQEIGDVDATDQQDQGGAGEERDQAGAKFAYGIALHGHDVELHLLLRDVAVGHADGRGHAVQILLGRIEGRARFQAGHETDEVQSPGRIENPVRERRQRLDVGGHVRIRREVELEIFREHADHGDALAVKGDAAADDVGIASKASAPESAAEEQHRFIAGPFIGSEEASERGAYAEKSGKIRGYSRDLHLLGAGAAREGARGRPDARNIFE